MNNPLSSRNTDLTKKDLVSMLRGGRLGSARYAVVDAARRMTHTDPPTAKGPKVPRSELRKANRGGSLRKIFG